jgi:hypothetical protein
MKAAGLTTVPGTEFDRFLYAPIGEERNGMLLSVLSALARSNVDPWEEAARLARLPHKAATSFLASLLAGLPDVPSARSDSGALAEHLINLLPQRVTAGGPSQERAPPQTMPIPASVNYGQALAKSLLVYLVLLAFFLVTQWVLTHALPLTAPIAATPVSQVPSHIAAPAPAPAPSAAPVSRP